MKQHIEQEEFQQDKFQSLVHYICAKCEDPRALGAVKLHKTLWYSDLSMYLQTGKSITGERYIKHQYGPFASDLKDTVRRLGENGDVVVKVGMVYDYPQTQYVALTRPDISLFNSSEISIVDVVIDKVCLQHTALSISEASHDDIWKLAEIGEEIPYYTILASRLGEITEDDIQWAKEQYKTYDKVAVAP